jgi:hypothetical protein
MMMVMISASIHLGRAQALALSCAQQLMVPARRELLPEIIHGTKQVEYTHRWNLLVIDTDIRFVLSYQERFPYPELTLLYTEYGKALASSVLPEDVYLHHR